MKDCKKCIHKDVCMFRNPGEDEITCANFKDEEAFVKAVRCKNCKNYELMTSNNAHFCNEYGGYVTEEDSCSRGIPITNRTLEGGAE